MVKPFEGIPLIARPQGYMSDQDFTKSQDQPTDFVMSEEITGRDTRIGRRCPWVAATSDPRPVRCGDRGITRAPARPTQRSPPSFLARPKAFRPLCPWHSVSP